MLSKTASRHTVPSMSVLCSACIAAYENLTVWADLLDRINVFPVADGDTGVNLRMSLAPLRECGEDIAIAVSRLSGVGNSGNIAVAFFREFLNFDEKDFYEQAVKARDMAWHSIGNPCSGTMLEVFDALCLVLDSQMELSFAAIRRALQDSVLATVHRLPELSEAGVVDSGALGMFVFFDAFFQKITGKQIHATPLLELFGDNLQVNASFYAQGSGEYCVEAILATDKHSSGMLSEIANLGASAVVVPEDDRVKVHLHTRDPQLLRTQLNTFGELVDWSDEAMDSMVQDWNKKSFAGNSLRIMSDAAASLPLDLARKHGVVLLDSYILAGDQIFPESLFSAEALYSLMNAGEKVTTAQASTCERHLHYHAACEQYGKVLYLCTGSSFTGNFSTVMAWKKEFDPENRLEVIDSGAASGRLAVMTLLTSKFAEQGASVEEVILYGKMLVSQVEEYVFIDEMKYLVAGGRVSITKGFFADLFHMKPVISPQAEGVRKQGVVKNRAGQLDFALHKLQLSEYDASDLFILLQYSDNKEWLQKEVKETMQKHYPAAEILLVPLSLTSGVHMGPGTWSVAFAKKGQ